jgi:two-component system, sensor histidine kinase and response regulator
MPEMDGITATRKIRHLDMQASGIPILAMTAHALAYEREKCIEAGMNEHIPKPIDPNVFFAALVEWIKPKSDAPVALSERKANLQNLTGLPDQLPGFDLDGGLSRVAGNQVLYRDLLFKFAGKQPQIMEDIQSAISGNDLIKAFEIAHKIKGMAGNIGAVDVHKTAHDLESALKSENLTAHEEALSRFSNAFQVAVNTILSMEDPSSNAVGATGSAIESRSQFLNLPSSPFSGNFGAVVKEIADLIQSDYGAAIKAVETLREMDGSRDLGEEVEQLAKAMGEFDEDRTKNVLVSLARKINVKL